LNIATLPLSIQHGLANHPDIYSVHYDTQEWVGFVYTVYTKGLTICKLLQRNVCRVQFGHVTLGIVECRN